MKENKIVIFTGAGISAESGIQTFRDSDGLWENMKPEEVASISAWKTRPEKVIAFHNARLRDIEAAQPNAAHLAVAELEAKYELVVITQNVDDLHERAGSTQVIHLHGKSTEVKNAPDDPECAPTVYQRGFRPIEEGETDEYGYRLRPNVVLFGEDIEHASEARKHLKEAGKVLVVGTSLQVEPAASLLKKAHYFAEKLMIGLEVVEAPKRFQIQRGKAAEMVPTVVSQWSNEIARKS